MRRKLMQRTRRDMLSRMGIKSKPANVANGIQTKPLNRSLHAAKQDEFYTQYVEIDNDAAADIEDVKLLFKKNKANRIALKGDDQYPGGDFRSEQRDISTIT